MAKREKGEKVSVSERAVLQRINRKLTPQFYQVKKLRGERDRHELGDYFEIDLRHNCIIGKDINIELYARELGALADWEQVAE